MEAAAPSAPLTADQKAGWTHSALLTRNARWLGLGVMVASLLLPASGRFGVDLCVVHNTTGLPCPGCGMTRAVIAVTHGDLATAMAMHPFVVFVWPFFFVLAVLALLPASAAQRLDAVLTRRSKWVTRVYKVVVFSFISFGAARFVLFVVMGEPFP